MSLPYSLCIDGGGTKTLARLTAPDSAVLAEIVGPAANIVTDRDQAVGVIVSVAEQALDKIPDGRQRQRCEVALALAGVEISHALILPRSDQLYRAISASGIMVRLICNDAVAACLGAHAGENGAVVVIGTGAIGVCLQDAAIRQYGGYGAAVSDEGGGAWLGREALRLTLQTADGRHERTDLTEDMLARFGSANQASHWANFATPADYGSLAPLVVDHAGQGDANAIALIERACRHVDILAAKASNSGSLPLSVVGGLAEPLKPWFGPMAKRLQPPRLDALDGALWLLRHQQVGTE